MPARLYFNTMHEITVTVGGRDYKIAARRIRDNREWRKSLESKFDGLVDSVRGFGAVDITQLTSVGDLLGSLKTTLIGSIDMVFDLVCEYAPEIQQDRERIENEAYDDEIIAVFGKILGLVFPLGKVMRLVNGLSASTT